MLCVVSLGFYLLDFFVWSVLREWKFTNKKVCLDRYFVMSTVSGIVLSTENTGMNKTHPTHVGSWSSRNKLLKMLLCRELNQHTRQKLCECSHTPKISEKGGGRPSSCGAGDPATWQLSMEGELSAHEEDGKAKSPSEVGQWGQMSWWERVRSVLWAKVRKFYSQPDEKCPAWGKYVVFIQKQ